MSSQLRLPVEMRLKESEDIQKQLENRILEAEKKNQQAQEERRKSLDTLEKQVGLVKHTHTHKEIFRKPRWHSTIVPALNNYFKLTCAGPLIDTLVGRMNSI